MTGIPVRIVVAEDNFLVLQEIKRCLEEVDCEVVGEASDGQQALDLVCKLKPDIALFDVKMPKMDGIEAAREVQRCCPVPVIILTAYESEDLVAKASDAGIAAFLVKPPCKDDIKRAIIVAMARYDDLLKLRQLNSELSSKIAELRDARKEIKELRAMLPICSFCKNIRDEKGEWHQIEDYIQSQSEAEFTHTVCPSCLEKEYPEFS